MTLPYSIPVREKQVWARIVTKRKREVQRMGEAKVELLLENPIAVSVGDIPSSVVGAIEKFDWILKKLIMLTLDPCNTPASRRDAYRNLKILLSRVENSISESTDNRNVSTVDEAQGSISTFGNRNVNSVSATRREINSSRHTVVESNKGNQDVAIPTGIPDSNNYFVVTNSPLRKPSEAMQATNFFEDASKEFALNSGTQLDTPSQNGGRSHELYPSALRSTLGINEASFASNSSVATTTSERSKIGNENTGSSSFSLGAETTVNGKEFSTHRGHINHSKNNALHSSNTNLEQSRSLQTSESTSYPRYSNSTPFQRNIIGHPPTEPNSVKGAYIDRQNILPSNPKSLTVTPSPSDASSIPNIKENRIPAATSHATSHQSRIKDPISVSSQRQGNMGAVSSLALNTHEIDKASAQDDLLDSKLPSSSSMQVNGKAPRFEIPPIPIKPQPSDAVVHKKWFPIGLPQFTGALAPRPMGEFSWKDSILTNNETLDVIRRLYTWEPYWDMVNILALTKTSIIESIAHMEKPKESDKDKFLPPQQHRAFEVKLAVPLQYQKLIQGWNSPKGERRYTYESGEVRLLLRMLPCNPPQKPTGKNALKKKVMRSDYHIWPKGTFLQIDGAAREIVQRKQQSHNTSEWSYLSRMLDMTQFVEAPESITVSALTHDADPYYLCVSVCRYRPPENLFEFLMKDKIQMLSREESIQIAMDYAKKNKVCVIDDVDHDQCGSSSFLFKLTCPISSTLMATPVRSHQCNHFQCFDLLNFLYVNANVSGTRWECPVCNDQTISVFDLQHCALTEKLLQQFKNEASSFRDRVEFFSDGTWKLMPERRKRYTESHSLQSNDTKRKKGAEVDLIIL